MKKLLGVEIISRIMVEGDDRDRVSEIARRIASAVEGSVS